MDQGCEPIEYELELDEVKLMKGFTVKVRLIRAREMRIRLWIAARLIQLACFVTGMGLEIEHGEVENE